MISTPLHILLRLKHITEACITAYYESFPDPPTGSPTDVGETNGGFYPDYDLLWVDGYCINTKPVPSGRPVYTSMLSCCQAAYAGQVSGKFVCLLVDIFHL